MTLAHLCLGTASWATDQPYNDRVPPDDAELRRILDVAEAGGIRWFDTAEAYGNARRRLILAGAYGRFRIVEKSKPNTTTARIDGEAAWLTHLGPDDAFSWPMGYVAKGSHVLIGASVYTVAQAEAALDAGVQVLQVPWNYRTVVTAYADAWNQPWDQVRDRAYADGVLFFGRQPFDRGRLAEETEYWPNDRPRGVFQWALQTNPRGWCVVGVETAAQVEELCRWREEM